MEKQTLIFLNSAAFVLGFTIVFALVGILLQTFLAETAGMAMSILRVAGGMIIVVFGISLLLSTKFRIPFLQSEHKIRTKRMSNTYISSFIFGIAFAIGWTPCVGAILGSIYVLAATSPGFGFLLLIFYALGLGTPFLLVGAFTSRSAGFIKRSGRFLKYFNVVGGLLLVAIGSLVLFNYIGILSLFLVNAGGASISGQLSFGLAFVSGIATFFSPCILPLVPAFLAYMAGTTALESNGGKDAN